jgi:hypothetical protein
MSRAQLTSTVEQNSAGAASPFVAGKNAIINGALDIWQRGTSFTPVNNGFMADRWKAFFDGTGATRTYSQQTFTFGSAPVAGYESTYFLRINQSVAGSSGTYNQITQPIENVRTFAGQTVTMSFWAKAASTTVMPYLILSQNFGVSGSADVDTIAATNVSIGTSWTRYSYTVALPSIAGKTIGANNYLHYKFYLPLNATFTFDLWGMQLEAGSVATPFTTATGTLQGELAACQRYYYRNTSTGGYARLGTGQVTTGTVVNSYTKFPVTLRAKPTALEQSGTASNYAVLNANGTVNACTSVPVYDNATVEGASVNFTVASGLTVGNASSFMDNNTTSAYLGWSAEL